MTRGYTLFAPSNDALTAAGSALASVANNQTALLALLGNHYINGTSRYSPTLLSTPSSPSSFISNSGQSLKFTSNSSGAYVITENTSSAKIIQSDVLVNNGVVHIVDRVLVDLGVDSSKAASAYASATSTAGQSALETGPIGALPASTSTSASASPSASAGGRKKSAAGRTRGVVGIGVSLGLVGVGLGVGMGMGMVL